MQSFVAEIELKLDFFTNRSSIIDYFRNVFVCAKINSQLSVVTIFSNKIILTLEVKLSYF